MLNCYVLTVNIWKLKKVFNGKVFGKGLVAVRE